MDMCSFGQAQQIKWLAEVSNVGQIHILETAFCQTCGECIIRKLVKGTSKWEIIYPKGPTRDKAPSEITKADAELASRYDEAVEVEPLSATSAVFLLGRCAEMILVRKAGVTKGQTLGPMIDEAIKNNKLEDPMSEYMKEGFRIARNQSGHLWEDGDGTEMTVDKQTVDGAFAMMNMLFDKFYIEPLRMGSWTAKLQRTNQEKVQGDKV